MVEKTRRRNVFHDPVARSQGARTWRAGVASCITSRPIVTSLPAVAAEKAVSVPGVQHRRVAWEAIILRRSFTRQGSWMCHGRSGRSCVAKSIGVR